ncbi:MAG: TraB/GumN family protein [Candidatus Melainabacteria bacterium]|nr:TraB/GumN family protein [Candidatus Melainabacteria bacterium]
MNLRRLGIFLPVLAASSLALSSSNLCLALESTTLEVSSASQASKETAAQTNITTEKKSDLKPIFLWKCKKNNQTIYLVGTIHVARPGFYPLPLEMQKALAESKILFVEADALQISSEKITETLKRVGIYPPGASLSEHLSDTTKDALNQYLEWSGESLSMYQPYKPWVVSQILTSAALRRAGYKSELGIDRHLLGIAHDSSKKIIPLESVDSQLNLMGGFNQETQDKQLLGSILSLRDVKTQLEKIENSWKSGDAEGLAACCIDASDKDQDKDKDLEAARVAILDKRNQSMLNDVKKNLPENSTVMIAVGAAHLVGEQGLLAKLKRENFSIEQLTTAQKKAPSSINFGGNNLKSLYFPEGLFRIMLPAEPEVKYETVNGIRMVDYAYSNLGGIMAVSYIVLPSALQSAERQQQFMQLVASAILRNMKGTNSTCLPIANASSTHNAAMQLSCKLPSKNGMTNQATYFRSRMIASGRRLYLVGGQGSADFFKSKLFSQFENSLEIIPESGYAAAPASRNSSVGQSSVSKSSFSQRNSTQARNSSSFKPSSINNSTWSSLGNSGTKFDFEAARREQQRKSDELRHKVRGDFERVRQQLDNNR